MAEPPRPAGAVAALRHPVDDEPPTTAGNVLFGLLVLDGLLLGGIGVTFTPLYAGPVPLPMGAVLSMLILPWLVLRAGEVDRRPGVAGAPLLAWGLVVGLLGLAGPGGDTLLPPAWPSLVLVVGGLGVGLLTLRWVLLSEGRARG